MSYIIAWKHLKNIHNLLSSGHSVFVSSSGRTSVAFIILAVSTAFDICTPKSHIRLQGSWLISVLFVCNTASTKMLMQALFKKRFRHIQLFGAHSALHYNEREENHYFRLMALQVKSISYFKLFDQDKHQLVT